MVKDALVSLRWWLLMALVAFLVLAPLVLQGYSIAPAVPGDDDRCPVCGMLVKPYPEWLAQVRLTDGTTLFFEGPKDMFRYINAPESYAKDRGGVGIVGGFVTTYDRHRTIPIEEAWFVMGSDVRGPAGEELVPLGSLLDANKFILEHGGMRVVQAPKVTPDLLSKLP